MELTQLKYFLAVSQSQHITRSAENLNISQSTLSISISNLEKELGVKLIEKRGRNVVLTTAGALFASKISPAISALENAKAQVINLNNSNPKRISLSIEILDFATQIEKTYLEITPFVRFRHSFDTTAMAMQKLQKRECHLCIAYEPFSVPEIISEHLISDRLNLLVHKNHPLASRQSVRVAELEDEQITCLPDGYGFNTLVRRIFRQAGIHPNIVYEACEFSMMATSVETNMFISFIETMTYNQAVYSGNALYKDLRVIPLEDEFCVMNVYLCYPKNAATVAEVENFKSYIKRCIPFLKENDRYPTAVELS